MSEPAMPVAAGNSIRPLRCGVQTCPVVPQRCQSSEGSRSWLCLQMQQGPLGRCRPPSRSPALRPGSTSQSCRTATRILQRWEPAHHAVLRCHAMTSVSSTCLDL